MYIHKVTEGVAGLWFDSCVTFQQCRIFCRLCFRPKEQRRAAGNATIRAITQTPSPTIVHSVQPTVVIQFCNKSKAPATRAAHTHTDTHKSPQMKL